MAAMNNGRRDACAMRAKGQAPKRIEGIILSATSGKPGFQPAGNPAAAHQQRLIAQGVRLG